MQWFTDCVGIVGKRESDEEESYDAFDQLSRLIGSVLPLWVPRPISSVAPYKIALVGLSIAQASLGLRQALGGDLYGGTYSAMLGLLGFNTSRSESHSELFKTYLVITFINGCVQGMEVFQMLVVGASFHGHIATLLAPAVSSAASYIGWKYVQRLRQPGPEYTARKLEAIANAWLGLGGGGGLGLTGRTQLPTIAEEEEDLMKLEDKSEIQEPIGATGGSGSPLASRGA